MLNIVTDFAHQYSLFTPQDRILVAVSGGADSVAILHVLNTLCKQKKIKELVCVHFNHQLRPEADQEQAFVCDLADRCQIRFVSESQSIQDLAAVHQTSIETTARHWRMQRLIALAKACECHAIATGHHLNDNAETLIHRLIRGTGYRGLNGIRPVRYIQDTRFISPLLNVTRDQIRTYLKTNNQTWCEDQSNTDQTLTRNYIRHTLLPKLLEQYPNLDAQLNCLALHCHRLYSRIVESRANALIESWVSFENKHAALSLTSSITQESHLVLVEAFRQIMQQMRIGQQNITDVHFIRLIQLATTRQGKMTLPGKVQVSVHKDTMHFHLPAQTQPLPLPAILPLNATTQCGPLTIRTQVLNRSQVIEQHHANRFVEYFDLDAIKLPIELRHRQAGDCFVPFGRKTVVKVGKFLNRVKERTEKEPVTLLTDQEKILWVCPIRMCDQAKIEPETRNVLQVSVKIDPGSVDRFQTEDECL